MKRGALPLGRNRWLFLYNEDGGDHLVHSVLAVYDPTFEEVDGRVLPKIGITECGIYVKLMSGTRGHAEQGVYVDDTALVNCIRCASGTCTDGISFRQLGKTLTFAERYGMRAPNINRMVQSSAADMSKSPLKGQAYSHSIIDEIQTMKGFKDVEDILSAWAATIKLP